MIISKKAYSYFMAETLRKAVCDLRQKYEGSQQGSQVDESFLTAILGSDITKIIATSLQESNISTW